VKKIAHMPYAILICVVLLSISSLIKPANETPEKTVQTMATNDHKEMQKKVQKYADEYDIKPIDAIVDQVWKAVPGYNGISVDVEASTLEMMKNNKFEKDLLIVKETPPKIHLEDLPPSPIYKGNSEKPMVALLINVAWGNEFIPQILDTLNDNQVKATFFFDGSWVKENPALAVMIYKEGHEIGNHAYSHPDLKRKSSSETMEELKKTNKIIDSTIDVTPKWFAPPSGSFNQETIDIARSLDMLTILWTVDTVDWKKPATDEMVNRVSSKVESGSMILMHPTKPTAEGLEKIIMNTESKGLHIGTVSDIMSEKRIIEK